MLHALSRNFAPIKVQRGEKSANKRIVLPVAPRLKRSATRHHHFNYRNIFPTGRGRTEYKSHPSTSKYKYRSIVSIEKRNANSTPTGQVSSFFPFLSFFLFLFFFLSWSYNSFAGVGESDCESTILSTFPESLPQALLKVALIEFPLLLKNKSLYPLEKVCLRDERFKRVKSEFDLRLEQIVEEYRFLPFSQCYEK